MSLFQKGPNGEERTAVELTVFKSRYLFEYDGVVRPPSYVHVQAHEAAQGLPDRLQIPTGRGAQPGGLRR